MLNVYEQVDQNKSRSLVIIAGFVLFVGGFAFLVGEIFGSDPGLVFAAVAFSLISAAGSFFWGDKIVLSVLNAKPATREKYFDFHTTAENLCLAAQIPPPSLYVIESPTLNAFATGRDPEHAVVCATTGLLQKLDRSELEGVIAHEISHIQNFDIRLMMVVSVLVGMITLASDWLFRGLSWKGGKRERELNPLVWVLGILALILSPLVAKLIQLAISRRREFLADASAIKLTRYPQGLIRALEKISADPHLLKTANPATAHLFTVNPLKNFQRQSFFATHPPIQERIRALEKML